MTVDPRHQPECAADAFRFPARAVGSGDDHERDTRWGGHSHSAHELIWNECGVGHAVTGRQLWTVTRTVGLWIPAGAPHSGSAPAGSRQMAVYFDASNPPLSDHPVAVDLTDLLRLLLDRLVTETLTSDAHRTTEQMIFDVLRPSDHGLVLQVPSSPLVAPVVDAVRRDPADRRTLKDWARELGVSTRTITRVFERETDLGFTRWLAAARAQVAVRLLGEDMPIAKVADAVGYGSASSFTTAFRRVTGTTPGQFFAADLHAV
ncbi:AraC family transcriptional regulator [Corynebacterium terpenotabidum]|uniref:HTH-type transcriptional regulator RipA n=1 Tax=Corynebacterium terpenotabidum Y-11 TaxID=1200352 RepID=S4XGX9_9CORY|nr:AraC family transcriptional regulator [Corynebacterium terpenotabidum]AGP31796.1 AraC family transcriptional regulator [Corynebacterium terpenotabidum Y-11]